MINNMSIYGNISLVYIIFFIVVIIVSIITPELLYNLSAVVRNIICIGLILKYNPYKKLVMTEQDGLIIFTAAVLLLTSAFIVDAAIYNLDRIQAFFKIY